MRSCSGRCKQRRLLKGVNFCLSIFCLIGTVAQEQGEPSRANVVLLWPEEAHTFLNGKGIIAALVTTSFDTPREGSIELLLNGNNAANFTPEAQDAEGNRRLHVVLPEMTDGAFSVEVRCIDVKGGLLARDGATFYVNATAPVKGSSAGSLEKAKLCHAVGFCDSDAECNGHGTCSLGTCLCQGDWVGETCEHDIYNNPSFMPDSNPGRSPSLCHRSSIWEQAAKDLQTDLMALHSLNHCVVTCSAFFIIDFRRIECRDADLSRCCDTLCAEQEEDNVMWLAAPHHGLGGNMHILSVALTHAYTHGKALGIVGEVSSPVCNHFLCSPHFFLSSLLFFIFLLLPSPLVTLPRTLCFALLVATRPVCFDALMVGQVT